MNKKVILPLLLLALMVIPAVSQAYGAVDILQGILTRIVDLLRTLFGGLIIIVFTIIGIMYLTAAGDAAKLSTASKALKWSTIGVVVILLADLAYGLIRFIVLGL